MLYNDPHPLEVKIVTKRFGLPNSASLDTYLAQVFGNALVLKVRAPLAVVRLPGVKSPLKSAKYGLWSGIKADIEMLSDLMQAVPLPGLVGQIVAMRRLRV